MEMKQQGKTNSSSNQKTRNEDLALNTLGTLIINDHTEINQVADCSPLASTQESTTSWWLCSHEHADSTGHCFRHQFLKYHKTARTTQTQQGLPTEVNVVSVRLIDVQAAGHITQQEFIYLSLLYRLNYTRQVKHKRCMVSAGLLQTAWKTAIRSIMSVRRVWSRNSKTHCYQNPCGLWDEATRDVLLHAGTAATSYMCP